MVGLPMLPGTFPVHPGRCPGLICGAPSGHDRANAQHQKTPAGALVAVCLAAAVYAGCRSEMYDQARYKPYAASDFFQDGTSARPLVYGTVPHSDVRGNAPELSELFLTGKTAGTLAESFPIPIDRSVLARGQERFRIFCTPCHGELGDGRGIVVRRGFTAPPTYHSDELRSKPPGHFVDVITRGFGAMSSYAARVPPRDRWAITAYIRALQLSQHAQMADLPSQDQRQLGEARP